MSMDKTIAEQNADIVCKGYAAFNTADVDALTDLTAENATWHTPGTSTIAGDAIGRAAVFAHFGRYGSETAGTFKADLREVFMSSEGRLVGLHHNSGRRNGKTLSTDCCIVFDLVDGRIVSGREHFYDLSNWDEFWS
ncbi:MAG: nuclear transport factor 2 family protein [Acidimicrobiales bacterium]